MSARINYFQTAPKAMGIMMNMEKYIASCYGEKNTLEHELIELIKIRVSQINGCAYCLDMHTKDAATIGMTTERINLVATWEDSHCYSVKEKLALAWAEATTLLSQKGISDDLYHAIAKIFNQEEIVDLTIVVNAINAWNRFGVSFLAESGVYQPGDFDF